MLKTYHGSCHCGAVRFAADIDLAAGTGKCNCSICAKQRFWSARIRPDAFRLVAGEGELTDYQFNSNSVHHLFCKHCGVHPYHWADIPQAGGLYYTVNVMCLDDASVDEIVEGPVTYFDGRNNNWWEKPKEIRHL